MPYVKSVSIRTTVNRSIAYILNPDKTEELLYTTSLNCMTNAKDAYLAMKTVYEHFSGEKFNAPLPLKGKGSVKAIHYIQSFDPQDNVSPELAHRIAKAFARKTFGDDCQIVIATHTDKNHIHNHLIINTYSISGQKFNANKATLNKIKNYSDRTCLAFGIQPYDKSKGKGKTMAYNEWQHKNNGTSWKHKIRIDIDMLIGKVKNLDELLSELETQGYAVKRGKYISIKADGQKRFVRTKTLGEDYTTDSLLSRIRWNDVGTTVTLTGEPVPLRNKYTETLDEITNLSKSGLKTPCKRDKNAPYSANNDIDIYKISAQLSIINRDNIHSIGELEGKIEKLKSEYENTRQELNRLNLKLDNLESISEQADICFELKRKSKLSTAERLQFDICKQTLINNNITSQAELDRLKALKSETIKKIAALEKSFKDCREMYEVYTDIADTYHEISKGDYISKLVAKQRKTHSRGSLS